MSIHATFHDHDAAPRPRPARAGVLSILLPDEAKARYRLYVALAAALYCAAWAVVLLRAHVKGASVDFVVSDAIGYYVYLPSVAIDGDLDFANQIETQFRGNVPPELRAGLAQQGWPVSARRNRFPLGVALSVSPGFALAHALSHAVHAATGADAFRPDGYSTLYMAFCVAAAMAIGAAGMVVADRLLVERFQVPGRCAAAAVLTFWLATNYLWFFLREPLVSHLVGASWVTFAVYIVHRIDRQTRAGELAWWLLPLLAFVTSMALVCRFTNAFLLPLFVYLIVILVRRRMTARALRQLPLVLLALAPLVIQAVVLFRMHGVVGVGSTQGLGYESPERFYWGDPALVRTLFSSRRGLFFWTPVLLFSAWGLIQHFVARRGRVDALLASLVICAMILWYVNASWYAWWLGNSLGHRGFVELAPLFVVGFGLAYARLETVAVTTRRAVVALVIAGALVNYTLIALKLTDRLDGHGPLLPWEDRVFTGRWERF